MRKYKANVNGTKDFAEKLSALGNRAQSVASQAVYEGAHIMLQELAKAEKSIRTEPYHRAGPGETRLPSPEEKAVVQRGGGGVAKFDKDLDRVQTSVGYGGDGYTKMVGKLVPIAKIAYAINSGTSFMEKQPFIRQAGKSGGQKAKKAMKEIIQRALDEASKE